MIGRPLSEVETPQLVVDLDVMEANLARMAAIAARAGAALRPHAKTHKTPAVAHRQLAHGARGITVAKLGEAEVMAAAGISDIFIANHVVGEAKLARLRALHRRVRIAVGLDGIDAARALSHAFAGSPLDVLVEIDTGQHRCGVAAGGDGVAFATALAELPGLRLRGIFTHEGHSYGARDRDEAAGVGLAAHRAMVETAAAIVARLGRDREGFEVSVGSSPSLLTGGIGEGVTEARPGTYVYMDAQHAGVVGHTDWCAAAVHATIVSVPGRDRAVADAGAKALSHDKKVGGMMGNVGHGLIRGRPDCVVERLSDEHAVISMPPDRPLRFGQRIEIIPNHICPCVNLFDRVVFARQGRVEAVLPVAARGRVD